MISQWKIQCIIVGLSLRWNATGSTVAGAAGATGTAANQLDHPFSVVLDSSNALYIADQTNNRIQKWIVGAASGTTIAGQSGGGWGTTSSDFDLPSAIVLDSNNNFYVADTLNNRIQYWMNAASSGSTVAGVQGRKKDVNCTLFTLMMIGPGGSANNELSLPYGIARNPISGALYIADHSNHRVMEYAFGASSGTVVAGGNGPGTSNTQLNLPIGVYFDSSSNSLIIANADGHNVVRWVLGASSWTLIAGSTNGTNGDTSMLLNYPAGVTLDSMGNVYVADRDNHRIQLFLAGQSTGITIAGITGNSGSNATMLNNPCSVALDAQLNLYVADTYNNRIQQFIRY